MTIYDELKTYTASDAYPFHMPGHKRRAAFLCDPAAIDLTEIDGFDNLHHAEGILKEAENRAAKLYGSEETHFLVNGSTAGVLSAIGACTRPGGLLLMARNSHRSAYHAAALSRVRCVYLSPASTDLADRCGPVDPALIEDTLEEWPETNAVFLTSPTYDGVVSDIRQIAAIAHRRGVPLIVDEAHGAHFGMHPIFPRSSVELGADLVIHSLHKTLPALTQTALIHVNGTLVDRARLRRFLTVYQTSSPSYVLMASMDQCITLLSKAGDALFDAYAKRLEGFYQETKLVHYAFLRTDDPSRILIHPAQRSCATMPLPGGSTQQAAGLREGQNTDSGLRAGQQMDSGLRKHPSQDASAYPCSLNALQLYHTLRERFHLQPEMAAPSYVLMLSSVCDDEEGFSRLSGALRTLDQEWKPSAGPPLQDADDRRTPNPLQDTDGWRTPNPLQHTDGRQAEAAPYTIAEALDAPAGPVPFSASEGRISGEFLTLYPPGIPLVVPGERIPAGLPGRILALKHEGYSITGPEDHSLQSIRVLTPLS